MLIGGFSGLAIAKQSRKKFRGASIPRDGIIKSCRTKPIPEGGQRDKGKFEGGVNQFK